jgi:hypothetical protein
MAPWRSCCYCDHEVATSRAVNRRLAAKYYHDFSLRTLTLLTPTDPKLWSIAHKAVVLRKVSPLDCSAPSPIVCSLAILVLLSLRLVHDSSCPILKPTWVFLGQKNAHHRRRRRWPTCLVNNNNQRWILACLMTSILKRRSIRPVLEQVQEEPVTECSCLMGLGWLILAVSSVLPRPASSPTSQHIQTTCSTSSRVRLQARLHPRLSHLPTQAHHTTTPLPPPLCSPPGPLSPLPQQVHHP